MPIYTDNLITPDSSARKLDAESLERLSALPRRRREVVEDEPVILRIPGFDYSTNVDHGLSENIHHARGLVQTATKDLSTSTSSGDVTTQEGDNRNGTIDGNGPSGPTEPPSSGPSSAQAENKATNTKIKEKKMSSASTLWTLGITTGALVLGSIGISLSPINEDLKKFLHVCAYSLTAFTGILLAALGLTEISDRTSAKKGNSNEEI